MGFRTGAYVTVWDIKPISQTVTEIRISNSRKDKNTGQYVEDFQGFVRCIGTVAAREAAKLQRKDRIKLGDCDVSTSYDKEKRVGYTNFKLFSFERVNGQNQSGIQTGNPQQTSDYYRANETNYPGNPAEIEPPPYDTEEWQDQNLPF